jgi:hypothetical protein
MLRSPKRKLREITLFDPRKRIPSARASGFLDFGFTQRNTKKRVLREISWHRPVVLGVSVT